MSLERQIHSGNKRPTSGRDSDATTTGQMLQSVFDDLSWAYVKGWVQCHIQPVAVSSEGRALYSTSEPKH